MKRILPFSKFFFHAAVFSSTIILLGIVGFFVRGGFNLGIDFQAGLIQEVQLAPTAFGITYSGTGNASILVDSNGISLVITAPGVESTTHPFPFSTHRTLNALMTALSSVQGIQTSAATAAPANIETQWLIQSATGNPQLGAEPFVLHYLAPNAGVVSIEDVRSSLTADFGTVAVQVLGSPAERRFMIRVQERDMEGRSGVDVINALTTRFGAGSVVVNRSDFVGSRFSRQLTDQAGILVSLTLLLILGYASIRFKPMFAAGAVIAIIHDVLFTLSFIIWVGMEFNVTTIAALLTIIGYSTNDTIVVFDRIRENRRLYPDDAFVNVLNRSLSETLNRTIITTVSTMFAVSALIIFTRGSMQDFAVAFTIGMISGVYSTTLIASGFVYYMDIRAEKNAKKKLLGVPAKAS